MNVGQPASSSSSLRESSVIRSHSPYCRVKGPIVEKGFVISRIRAIHEACNQIWASTWPHSPIPSYPIQSRLQKYESYSSAQPRGTPKAHQRPSILSTFVTPLPESNPATEWTSEHSQDFLSKNSQKRLLDDRTHFGPMPPTSQMTREDNCSLQLDKVVRGITQGSTPWKDDVEKCYQIELPQPSSCKRLKNTGDNAPEPHFDANTENTTKSISSLSLGGTNKDKESTQGQSPILKSPASRDLSLRPLIKRSLTSLLSTTDDGSTSVEISPRPKKYQIRRKAMKPTISHTLTETSQSKDPSETPLPFSLNMASPKNFRRAFSLQPSSKLQVNTSEPIELRPISTDLRLHRSHYQGAANYPDETPTGHSSSLGEPLELPVSIESPRQFISDEPNSPRRLSSSASARISSTRSVQVRKRWSGWKLRPVEKQPESEKKLDMGLELVPQTARQATDEASLPTQDSPAKSHVEPAPDQRLRHTIFNGEIEGDGREISDSTNCAESSANTNKSRNIKYGQPPPSPKASVIPIRAYPEPQHPLLHQPKPQRPQLHHHLSELVTKMPQELNSRHSSPGAVSPVPSHVGSPNRSSRKCKKPRRIKSIQVVVNFDGPADTLSEAVLERKGKRFF